MRRLLTFALLAALTLPTLAYSAPRSRTSSAARSADEAMRRRMLGAWEIVWPAASPERVVKLITPTHFSWTRFEPATHRVLASGGGAYTLVGDGYCEQLDFAMGGVESAAGRVLCFRVEVHGDTLLQVTAPGSDGTSSREIWRRLR